MSSEKRSVTYETSLTSLSLTAPPIILTMFDRRTSLSRSVQEQVRASFGSHVLKTVIPRSIRMAEAPSKGLPGIIYRPRNPAAEEYRTAATELLQHTLLAEA